MKKAIIYFEGNVVTDVLCDNVVDYNGYYYFKIKDYVVACFPISYGLSVSDIILSPKYTPAP
mgnify:CR=1 FL=1